MNDTTTTTPAIATTIFTLPIHFKNWVEGSKGHKDLLALQATGAIADWDKEVTASKNEDDKVVYKRNSLNFNITTIDMVAALAGSGLSAAQVEHAQELVNAAIKKDIKEMVIDTTRTSPLTDTDLPTGESVLSQPFNKRPVTIKVTLEMIAAAVKPLIAFLVESGVKEGGVKLTESLCTKKFSLAALNAIDTPVLEKINGLVMGWFEAISEGEQQLHFPVVNLWATNIDAKLNPKSEDISIDMF